MQANRDRLRPDPDDDAARSSPACCRCALGTGPGAEERRAVAVVVIGGQTLACCSRCSSRRWPTPCFDDLSSLVARPKRRTKGDEHQFSSFDRDQTRKLEN